MSLTTIVLASSESSSPIPWIVGGSIFVGLLAGMLALLIFGQGRPHS
jgi:hypothetical protein